VRWFPHFVPECIGHADVIFEADFIEPSFPPSDILSTANKNTIEFSLSHSNSILVPEYNLRR
jgi:hypothetical protein